jgi:hypothetical protein
MGENTKTEMEGGGLEEILTWPPEMFFHCRDHARRRPKAGNRESKRRCTASASRDMGALEDNHFRWWKPSPRCSQRTGAGKCGRGLLLPQIPRPNGFGRGGAGRGGAGSTGLPRGVGLQLSGAFRAEGGVAMPGPLGPAVGGTRCTMQKVWLGFPTWT